ncbi:MAG TPA: hypothetical protein DIC50_08955 [Verrucomicrobia subdivision 3 bacterium]|nr:hypothetical protein [Limisphaerales bacterium]
MPVIRNDTVVAPAANGNSIPLAPARPAVQTSSPAPPPGELLDPSQGAPAKSRAIYAYKTAKNVWLKRVD